MTFTLRPEPRVMMNTVRILDDRLVDAATYLASLTSREPLVRSDEPRQNLVGLLNARTGNRILVSATDLDRLRRTFPAR